VTIQDLDQVEAAAGRVILDLEAGRVREAREEARKCDSAAQANATGGRDGLDAGIVAALRARTSTLAGLADRRAPALVLAQAANRVRDLVAERGGEAAIAALLRLDNLEREVGWRSVAGQTIAAKAAALAASDAWEGVRPGVAAAAGEELADHFDEHLTRLQHHEEPAEMQDEARLGRELVAAMRRAPHARPHVAV
jgi:hypothetical protein